MDNIEFVKRGAPNKYQFDLAWCKHLGDAKHYADMSNKEAQGLRSYARVYGYKLSVKKVVQGGYFATVIGAYK